MSKTTKPEAEAAVDAPPKKSKKKLIIIIAAAVFLIAGGTTAFLLLKPSDPAKSDQAEVTEEGDAEAEDDNADTTAEEDTGDEEEAHPDVPPTYAQLGTFTANLIHEEGDRYLQVAIELKLTVPELAEKIKATNPEILHHINMLLQSKRPSELASFEGKQKLAAQIKEQVEYVLGLRKTPTTIAEPETTVNTEEHAANAEETTPNAGEHTDKKPPASKPAKKTGVAEVLFTSFIIQ